MVNDDIHIENRLSLARLERKLDTLARMVESLVARQVVIGPADSAVLGRLSVAIYTAVGDAGWTISELRDEAARRPLLQTALVATGLNNVALSKLFARCEGGIVHGMRIERVRNARGGIRRRIVEV